MKRVQAVIRPEKLEPVQHRLADLGFAGMMVADVRGHGSEAGAQGEYRGSPFTMTVKHKLMVDLLVEDDEVTVVVDAIASAARTGQVGDGLIFVQEVTGVYQIRTGATGGAAVGASS